MKKCSILILGVAFLLQVGHASAEGGVACGGKVATKCSGSTEFCNLGAGKCTTPEASGVCRTKPQICTMDYTPVCGCDEVTYANSCNAAAAGASVDHAGECAKKATSPSGLPSSFD